MNPKTAGALLFAIGVLAWLLRPRALPAQSPDTRAGSVTFDPLEPVGGIGNVNPYPGTTPYPSDRPTLGPAESGNALCDCAPLGSFGPACFGVTWTAYSDRSGYQPPAGSITRELTPQQRAAVGLDATARWYGIDYRQRKPVRCG